jgi:hypothetical protein
MAGAMVVFGEHLPAGRGAASMRLAAFALTIAGSALLTNPVEELAAPEALRRCSNQLTQLDQANPGKDWQAAEAVQSSSSSSCDGVNAASSKPS